MDAPKPNPNPTDAQREFIDPILIGGILSLIAELLSLLRSRGITIDEAIAALDKAQGKSIDDYIRLDAEARKLPPVP